MQLAILNPRVYEHSDNCAPSSRYPPARFFSPPTSDDDLPVPVVFPSRIYRVLDISDPIPDAEVGYRLRCRAYVHIRCDCSSKLDDVKSPMVPPSAMGYLIRHSFAAGSLPLSPGESLFLNKALKKLPVIVVRYLERGSSFFIVL